ncbi:MAG: ABC transporter ATP-binding protein [Planctomycetaceae bacterium]|nr:ABC transporter ATP-binding protein [Planctomycetaceae bacterium]
MSTPILSLEHVTKRFGGVTAVDDVSFAINEGELRCLIGPNGAGKSTLFRLITGYFPVTSGTIRYRGGDLGALPSFRRARMGISIKFQTPMVYYDQTMLQNLVVPLQRRLPVPQARRDAAVLLDKFGIGDGAHKLASEVAHGYRQWLEICMAVATRPSLLLLDEPTAGMSPEETKATAGMIHDLVGEGMTVVVIDHDMEFVRMLNCNLTVLHLGRFFAQGTLAEIQANPEVRSIYLGKK